MEKKEEQDTYNEIEQNCIENIVEDASCKALGVVLSYIKEKYGKATIATGKAFKSYLKNSEIRYNKVKTLADLSEPRALEGKNGIYVDTFVKYRTRKISLTTSDELLKISNNVVIIGSGGSGKSMIMRHLFLNTLHRGEYIPVLVELRRITNTHKANALIELIHTCIEAFDVKLDQSQLEYSLRTGKYLFLFDGLDEVKEENRGKTEMLIQQLSKKYPENKYIVSSREEGVNFCELETYTLVKACPLKKEQAIQLILKLGRESEKANEFSKLVNSELYDKHNDFASNPLLLTMMYITFMDNNLIPEHLTDFYDSAYDALYKRHDANKEGLFKREYKCKMLGEREFKDLFAYFCFHSYFKQQYEFGKDEICEYIERGIERLNLEKQVEKSEDFFDDIKDIVCLIVEEGNKYKFAHRSFQTYFSAYYTSIQIADEQQKVFFKKELQYSLREDFFYMLYRLEGERFIINILEPGINFILNKIKCKESEEFEFLKILCQGISVHDGWAYRALNSSKHIKIPYERSIVMMFEKLVLKDKKKDKVTNDKIIELMGKLGGIVELEIADLIIIEPIELRNELIELIYKHLETRHLLNEIKNWDISRKQKRESLKKEQAMEKILFYL